MTSRERVISALTMTLPDMVPYMYGSMDGDIQQRIVGRPLDVPTINGMNSWGDIGKLCEPTTVEPVVTGAPEMVEVLHVDAIGIQLVPPLFAEAVVEQGRAMVKTGLLTSPEALSKAVMPDPDDERILSAAARLLERCRGDHAVYARVRLGAAPTLLSMGIEAFSYSLIDNPELVADVLTLYTEWGRRFFANLSELDFDFFWCFDDIAFKSAPLFSPEVLREFFIPALRRAVSGIAKPWIFHSDGNLLPILDDLLELGMNGLHPLEPGAMDLDLLKRNYGRRLCLVGNVDIDTVLTRGSEAEVEAAVKDLIERLGPGGGYIISDSNSVPAFCRAENIIAMSRAVDRFRRIYP